MPISAAVLVRPTLQLILSLLFLTQGIGLAQKVDGATQTLATGIFGDLGVRVVSCPAYTFDGGNSPICGVSELAPEDYVEAFDRAAQGKLEPQGAWDEDHTVWLRRYRAGGASYAAVYSEIARGFNVQFIRLK